MYVWGFVAAKGVFPMYAGVLRSRQDGACKDWELLYVCGGSQPSWKAASIPAFSIKIIFLHADNMVRNG